MPIDPERWTQKTQQAVSAALARATKEHHAEITPDHLLAAVSTNRTGSPVRSSPASASTPRWYARASRTP
ncbi:MAG: hypothetical protein M0Z93_08440 [Actinomycetota bacterium]|nr:hypothetical protein [Actinomycetota bacterium]